MDENEQQFYAWLGRGVIALLVPIGGGLVWLWKWVWDRVHVSIPTELRSMDERIAERYATKESLVKLEQSLRDALREIAEQRREQHAENVKKMDTMSDTIREDIGDIRRIILEGERRAHARMDEHVERHHSR